MLTEFTDGRMQRQAQETVWPDLIEQGPEGHDGEADAGIQRLGDAVEFGAFHRANDQPACGDEADDDGRERAQGDFPPDAEIHAGMSASRSLYPRDLTEMMASFKNGSFCLSRRTWTSTVRVVP